MSTQFMYPGSSVKNLGKYQYGQNFAICDTYVAINKIPSGNYQGDELDGWSPEVRISKTAMLNQLGNASASDVRSGVSFSSQNGVKMVGTLSTSKPLYTLLWTNPNSYTTFNAGSYSVPNMANYTLFVLKYRMSYVIDSTHANINYTGALYQLMTEGNTFLFGADDTLYYRNVSINRSAQTIAFSLVALCKVFNSMVGQSLNTRLIPIALYGINQ